MAVTTTSSLNSLFNNILEDALFVAREMSLMAGLVTMFTATGMAPRKVGIYAQLTAQVVAENQDYANATELSKSALATFTPQIIMAQTILTDTNIETDPNNARQAAATELGGAVATKIDTDLVGEFTNFSTGKGTAGSALTIANVASLIAVIRKNHAPNPVYAVLHPYHWFDLWTELGQPASNKAFLGDTANEAMRSYAVGDFLGAAFFMDSNITVDSSDDAISGVFNRQAIAADMRRPFRVEAERDASFGGGAWELNASSNYDTGLLRSTYGGKLTADATEPS